MGNLHWLIFGGESAGPSQDFRTDSSLWAWARFTRDDCKAFGVAFFCKQGNKGPGWADPIPDDLQIHEWPEVAR